MQHINKERLVDLFCQLARIKSPSGYEAEISKVVIERLAELGLDVVQDSYGNIIAKLSGEGEPIILCGHLDTVSTGEGKEINPVVGNDKITSDGDTILGADNKDSISAILEALTVITEKKLSHRAIEIVLTREEEAISKGAKNLDFSLLDGTECVISDSADPYGLITKSAPCCFKFDVEIKGTRCHVKEPEKGVNVLKILINAVSKIPLGRVDEFTTSNIAYQVTGLKGVIDNNDKLVIDLSKEGRNTVPDFGIVSGEVRGAKTDKAEEVLQRIEKVFVSEAKLLGGSAVFMTEKLADGYFFEKDNPLILSVCKVFEAQGVVPRFMDSTGGSDANILNGRGVNTVVVSSAHRDNHKVSEYLIIEDLVKLADFYLRLVTF